MAVFIIVHVINVCVGKRSSHSRAFDSVDAESNTSDMKSVTLLIGGEETRS